MNVTVTELDAILASAIELSSPEEREDYLRRVCKDNAELRRRIDELLAAHFAAGDFLERPPATALYRDGEDIQAGPGTIIGPYKLLQQIGEGGMGVVFMAEQTQPIQRTVALKIIKPGMDTRQVIARFEAERQALAVMDHPNIAKVLDAGTTDAGRPYFVMELVKGVPITKYCDDHKFSVHERLQLFKPICEAVQHAHQKGIIHRDLKPTNVLVAEYDNHAVPKIIDFGVAKATAQKLTERTMFTEFGQVIGTVEYMSPEQAKLNQLDIDTRSDIYALGVLLYELLTGSTPFERDRLRSAAFDEVLRIIREDEPPKPSTRLSTSETLPSIAANRHTEPARLNKDVRGELDWIVMRCLEKDRQRRYQTASALFGDLENYLSDRPITACPPSTAYRLKKFIRRNIMQVVAISAVAIALVVGFIVATVGFIQARHHAHIAETEQAKAKAISNLLQNALQSADPEGGKGAEYTLRELLDDISTQIEGQLVNQPEVEIEIRNTVGLALRRLGYAKSAEPHFAKALELASRVYGTDNDKYAELLVGHAQTLWDQHLNIESEKALREALSIYHANGTTGRPLVIALWKFEILLANLGRKSEAERAAQEALDAANASGSEMPEVASILHRLVRVKLAQRDYAAAEELGRRSVDMHRRVVGNLHLETGWGLQDLGVALVANKKPAEAETAYREALAIFRRHYKDNHFCVAFCARTLASLTNSPADWDQAECIYREIIRNQPDDAGFQNSFGNMLATRRKLAEAEAAHRAAVKLSPNSTGFRFNLADDLAAQKKYGESAAEFRKIIGALPQDPVTYFALGRVLLADGKLPEAEAVFRDAIRLRPKNPSYRINLVKVLAAQEKYTDAETELREVLSTASGDPHTCNDVAWFLVTISDPKFCKFEEAVQSAKKAVDLAPSEGNYWNTLGIAQVRAGDSDAAVKSVTKAMELRAGGDAFDWFFLAMAHWQLGHKDEARTWYDKAVEWMDKNNPKSEELVRFRAEAAELLNISQPAQSSSDQPKSSKSSSR